MCGLPLHHVCEVSPSEPSQGRHQGPVHLHSGLYKPMRNGVAFLGYALQVTLKHLLKRSGSEYSPAEALKRLTEIHGVDIVLPTVEGVRELATAHPAPNSKRAAAEYSSPAENDTARASGAATNSKM